MNFDPTEPVIPFWLFALTTIIVIFTFTVLYVYISHRKKVKKQNKWLRTLKKGSDIRYCGTAFKITYIRRKNGLPTKIHVRSESIITPGYFNKLTPF
ncbi:MAG: hypothetical protein ACW964_09885 [Candidatus Hodarchaeales archaeon]|jgi:preprotein translocase subunit YajC